MIAADDTINPGFNLQRVKADSRKLDELMSRAAHLGLTDRILRERLDTSEIRALVNEAEGASSCAVAP